MNKKIALLVLLSGSMIEASDTGTTRADLRAALHAKLGKKAAHRAPGAQQITKPSDLGLKNSRRGGGVMLKVYADDTE